MKTRLLPRVSIPKEGSHSVSDKTDPDWADKRINQIARDLKECPAEWREQFLAGLEKRDIQELIDRGFIV